MACLLSVVIPTRNRPDDLRRAVVSVLAQTETAHELLIIDQSPGTESREAVESLFRGIERPSLVYVHDTTIGSLVEAKREGSRRAVGDIICFLEDDVLLAPGYLAGIEWGFAARPEMLGCGGVVVNQPRVSRLYVRVRSAFFRGIFHDPRPAIFAMSRADGDDLVRCDVLSGGVSSWRREVFQSVDFDVQNPFFMFEDMEFSTRVVRTFGHRLYINPSARLEHHPSPVNRDIRGARQRRKLAEALLFFKKRRSWTGAYYGLTLVLVWWFGEAVLQSLRLRRPGPVWGYVRGVIDGITKPLAVQRTKPELLGWTA